MSKQFWAILIAIAILFVGVVLFNNQKESTTKSSNAKPTSHVEGQGKTGVKLVEYGDFQCPACASFYPIVKEVASKYDEQITFQFRNLPLPSLHQNAVAAARAAEAAAIQGKYWEMHDKIYTDAANFYNNGQTGSSWVSATDPMPYFKSFAGQLGLDETKFANDYKSSKVNDAINADIAAFDKTGADKGTPSFFLNGKKVETSSLVDDSGAPTVDSFSKVLDEAIKNK